MEHVDLDLKTIALHNCGLAPELAEMPQTEGVMQPDDWRRIIQELYLHGGYSTLLGRYMRNYNTRFDVFRLLGGTDSSVPESRATTDTIDVGYGTFKALDLYLTNHSNMPMLLIGVDIGGTLTKIQVYQYDPQASCKMKPIGEASRMQTGDPDSSMLAEDNTNAGKALAIGTQRFAERLVGHIARGRDLGKFTERLKEPTRETTGNLDDRREKVPVVIGLTWPGPIRDGHIAGHSNPVKLLHWPKAPKEVEYLIDEIFEVDIPGAVSKAWTQEFCAEPVFAAPFVALLNDGDGEAVGAIQQALLSDGDGETSSDIAKPKLSASSEPSDKEEGRLAVVKLGTGLAGGFFLRPRGSFALQKGLFEWGKCVLDVGAPPREGFPQGVAAEYLSKRCLPRIAKIRGKSVRCFQPNDLDLDSGEIGRIAELWGALNTGSSASASAKSAYDDLVQECGARQAERSRLWQIPVSVEVVRRLLDIGLANKKDIEPDLLYSLQIALRIFDPGSLLKKVKHDVVECGKARLQKILEWPPEHTWKVRSSDSTLKSVAKVVEESIAALGQYLGDFCVLLHDQLGVNEIILAGGVSGAQDPRKAGAQSWRIMVDCWRQRERGRLRPLEV
ncbi:MAG TPA: hypothetical protein DHV85_07340 [Candidatus Accumulibacter sp.]|nr:hypothetical protein [Accumulibacter sp.]HRF10932.1 hypothetical protein [Candidatus Accumulibacter phosphatis]